MSLDLSGLTGARDGQHSVQQPLPQQGGLALPASAPGLYTGSGPYGVSTPNGTFEVLHHQHPMAHGLPAGMGGPQVHLLMLCTPSTCVLQIGMSCMGAMPASWASDHPATLA